MADLEFLFAVLFAAAVLVRLADYIGIPYPIVLVVAGVGVGFAPGVPRIELDPDVTFLVFLPPLLHSAAFYASPKELRTVASQLLSLTFVLVLATMGFVAVVAHAMIDGLGWPAAFVLGAILAPTDPVSAAATFSRMGVPERVALTVESEAMLNDAAALVAYRVAVTALVSGSFAAGDAALDFALSALGGLAVGVAVGWIGTRIQRRLDDVPLAIFMTVLFAYGAYIGGEEVGASGVLATVAAGMWFGWRSHEMFDADTRLNAIAFWEVLIFALNATLFVLLGLQLGSVVDELQRADLSSATLAGYVAVLSATVVGLRMAWLAVAAVIGRFVPERFDADVGEDWRERFVIGWSGMRGAISLAAVLALPTTLAGGEQFAQRDLLIFVTAGVIVVTLVGQGLTLAPLMRLLKISGERRWSPDEAIARLEAAQAALDRLEELEDSGDVPEERARRLRELYEARFARCMVVLRGSEEEADEEARRPVADYSQLRRELIRAERAALLDLRDRGQLKGDVMRMVQRDLDLEEARLPV